MKVFLKQTQHSGRASSKERKALGFTELLFHQGLTLNLYIKLGLPIFKMSKLTPTCTESSVLFSLHTPCFILWKCCSVVPLTFKNPPSQPQFCTLSSDRDWLPLQDFCFFPSIGNFKAIVRLHMKYDSKVTDFFT